MPIDLTQERVKAVELNLVKPEGAEARLRALFALVYHEAGVEPDEPMIVRLSSAMLSLGLTIRPLVTRW